MKNILIIGDDRSGGSYIAKRLSTMLEANLFLHPFNSTVFRDNIFLDSYLDEFKEFFDLLHANRIKEWAFSNYFNQHFQWSSYNINNINVWKSTISHFHIDMFKKHYFDIVYVKRDKRDIINSLLSNNVLVKWYDTIYVDGLKKLKKIWPEFFRSFEVTFSGDMSREDRIVLFIALRQEYGLINSSRIIRYEEVKRQPHHTCIKLIKELNLEDRVLTTYLFDDNKDHNVLGVYDKETKERPISQRFNDIICYVEDWFSQF